MMYSRLGVTVCLNVTFVIWNYLKSWLAAHCILGNVPFFILYSTNKSHHLFGEAQCHIKLCVKDGPASLKSQCVNKLQSLLTT